MTQQHRFLVALRRLQDWYAPSVKAQAFTGRTSSSSPGPRVLVSQEYPGTRDAWESWRRAHTAELREAAIVALEDELYRLGMAQSQRYALHRNTADWKRAIGTAEGSTRQVARLWGVSKTTVSRYRKEFSQAP